MTKLCRKCDQVLPLEEFARNAARHRGVQAYCRPCTRDYANALYARTRAQTLNRYGLTKQEWDDLYESQLGCCAICAKSPEKTLHVDHDHQTGKMRGLLCGECNLGIGKFGDDPSLLREAAVYLERSRG